MHMYGKPDNCTNLSHWHTPWNCWRTVRRHRVVSLYGHHWLLTPRAPKLQLVTSHQHHLVPPGPEVLIPIRTSPLPELCEHRSLATAHGSRTRGLTHLVEERTFWSRLGCVVLSLGIHSEFALQACSGRRQHPFRHHEDLGLGEDRPDALCAVHQTFSAYLVPCSTLRLRKIEIVQASKDQYRKT